MQNRRSFLKAASLIPFVGNFFKFEPTPDPKPIELEAKSFEESFEQPRGMISVYGPYRDEVAKAMSRSLGVTLIHLKPGTGDMIQQVQRIFRQTFENSQILIVVGATLPFHLQLHSSMVLEACSLDKIVCLKDRFGSAHGEINLSEIIEYLKKGL